MHRYRDPPRGDRPTSAYLDAGAQREEALAAQYRDAYARPPSTHRTTGATWRADTRASRDLDTPELVPRALLVEHLATLSPVRLAAVCRALRDAVHCTALGWEVDALPKPRVMDSRCPAGSAERLATAYASGSAGARERGSAGARE